MAEEELMEGMVEEQFIPEHSLMELFEELSFREKWARVMDGLKMPKDSGEYKWARLQMTRLSAPISAVLIPTIAALLLGVMLAVRPAPPRRVEVTIIEPEPVEELEEIEEIQEEIIEPPEPIEYEIPDVTLPESLVPSPPTDFSPQPAQFDSVAIVKSPVIMKGIYGSRSPGARGAAIRRHGGGGTEGAVMAALRWLKKNQNADGSWDKTKPAMTALALLTFLAHGETPASQEFGYTVERAIYWLVENQKGDGHFNGADGHDYSQPIAAYALAEAYGLTQVPTVLDAARQAVDVVINGQQASGGFGYNLRAGDNRNDSSYFSWCVQALKAAKLAEIYGTDDERLQNAMDKAIGGVKANYKDNNGYGSWGYTSPGDRGLTGAGVVCLMLLGAGDHPECRNGLAGLGDATFNWEGGGKYNANYYWYYITQAKFNAGGATWNDWNKMFALTLVKNQTVTPNAIQGPDGEMKAIGYWNMDRAISGHTDGDVMNTCLATLQLEVYYRYLPTFKTVEREDAPKPVAKKPQADEAQVVIDI